MNASTILLGDGPHECLAHEPTPPWERRGETMPYTIRRKADGTREAAAEVETMPHFEDHVRDILDQTAADWVERFAEEVRYRFRKIPDMVQEEVSEKLVDTLELPLEVVVQESEYEGGFTPDLRDWFVEGFRYELGRAAAASAERVAAEARRLMRMAFRKHLAELLDKLDEEACGDC